MNRTCCYTGHRPQYYTFKFNESHPDCIKVKELIREETIKAIESEYKFFVAGGALGVDTWAAEIVLELKKTYPKIKLIIAVPCLNQDKVWINDSMKRYRKILEKADKVVYVSEEEYKPSLNQMDNRNKFMVDKSSLVIAVFSGINSGTKNAVDYAKVNDKRIAIINPMDFSVTYHI